jgi:hypothetical protein
MRANLSRAYMPRTTAVFDRKVQNQEEDQAAEKDRYAKQEHVESIHARRNGRGLLWKYPKKRPHNAC